MSEAEYVNQCFSFLDARSINDFFTESQQDLENQKYFKEFRIILLHAYLWFSRNRVNRIWSNYPLASLPEACKGSKAMLRGGGHTALERARTMEIMADSSFTDKTCHP